ncbi:MAG: photosynthetic complex assembly protein PuhC, partial [Steroidobacteraceae bacterium]
FSIAAALAGRLNGAHAATQPNATSVETRELLFTDRRDGAVLVTEPDGSTVAVVAPGTGGFLRGVVRGLAQERMRQDAGADTPFQLTRWGDGRISLTDPVTGRNVYLDAFGPSNVAAFAALLERPAPNPHS